MAAAAPGGRNLAVFVAAANLGELVAGGALTAAEVPAALTEAAEPHVGIAQFTAAEVQTAITSGLRKGASRPRRIEVVA